MLSHLFFSKKTCRTPLTSSKMCRRNLLFLQFSEERRPLSIEYSTWTYQMGIFSHESKEWWYLVSGRLIVTQAEETRTEIQCHRARSTWNSVERLAPALTFMGQVLQDLYLLAKSSSEYSSLETTLDGNQDGDLYFNNLAMTSCTRRERKWHHCPQVSPTSQRELNGRRQYRDACRIMFHYSVEVYMTKRQIGHVNIIQYRLRHRELKEVIRCF